MLIRARWWTALAPVVGLSCQSPALVRTARTLPEGGKDLSFSLNLTRVSLAETRVNGVTLPLRDFNLPNPMPDISFDYGLTDGVEIGARVSIGSGLVEARSKLRLIEALGDKLNVALGPAAGYRALGLVNGPVFTLPLIITYDLNSGMSLSGGPVASFASYSMPHSLAFGSDLDISGDTLYAGWGAGIEFRPAFGIHVMPAFEVQRSIVRHGDIENLPVIDMLFFGLTFGWGSRRPAHHDGAPDRLEPPPSREPPGPYSPDAGQASSLPPDAPSSESGSESSSPPIPSKSSSSSAAALATRP
jgi:hypothetical protein